MTINFIRSIVGLLLLGLTQGRENTKYHIRSNGELSPALATTEAPPVNVSSTLANYEGLNLVHNADQKTIGFVNVTENVGISITDENGNVKILLLDSKTGKVICFKNLDKVTLVQNNEFRGDVIKSLDLIFENYIFKNEPIAGSTSEIEYSSEDALTILSDVYLHLGHPKAGGSKDYRSLKYIKVFAKGLNHFYEGPLNGLIVGNGPFPLKNNLNRFITISVGLHELFSAASGGLKNILSKNVTFEVNSLFNAKNGAEVLVYVLRQTGAKFDLSLLFGNLLNDIDKLLDIIGKLGGGESQNGVDETFSIINHFWGAIHLKIPITDFVQFLFKSASEDHWSQADDGDFQQVLKDLKNVTDQQSKKYDSVIKTSGFVKFFTNLTANQLIENNVNISELVEKWRKRDAIGGLKTITHLFANIFNPGKYSSLFFDSFTAFLNSTSDKDAVQKIIPGVPLEDFTNKEGSFLQNICKNYKLDEQLKKGADPSQVLNGVPVFNEFSKVYKNSLGSDFDFAKILNGGNFSDYLSKLNIQQPFKIGVDTFSKFVHESGSIFSHIFLDPIRHFLPIPNLPDIPNFPGPLSPAVGSPNIPFLPPGIIPSLPPGIIPSLSPGIIPASASIETTQKAKTEDEEPKVTKLVVVHTDGSDSPSTENPTTVSNEEHLTASVSSIKASSGQEVTEGLEIIKETTTTECSSCNGLEDVEKTTKQKLTQSSTEETLEFKHHRNRHHHRNHAKGHRTEKEYKHHNHENSHENKHHSRKHQEKHHHEKKHHNKRLNNGDQHQEKYNSRRNSHHPHEENNRRFVKNHDRTQERRDLQR